MNQRKFNIGQILFLSLGGGVIYVLPYLRFGFWDAMITYMNLTNFELGQLGAVYSVFAIPSYFIGGVLADKFSPRKLLAFSFMVTGILGFYFATLPGYTALLIIHAIWGVSTSLTFWCAFQALTRLSAPPERQAKAFGIVSAGRSVLYLVLSSCAIWLSTFFVDPTDGFIGAITLFSIFYILISFAFIFLMKDQTGGEAQDDTKKFKMSDVKIVLLMPEVWMLCAILFFVHLVLRLGDVFTPYASSSAGLGLSSELGGVLGMLKSYGTGPIAGLIAVVFADKFGRIKFSVISIFICALTAIGLIVVPPSYTYISIAILLALMTLCWISYMLVFSILDDAGIPDMYSGTVIGIVSGTGFISEPIANYVVGYLMDAYPGTEGFHMIFQLMVVSAFVSIGFYFVFSRFIKSKKAQATLA